MAPVPKPKKKAKSPTQQAKKKWKKERTKLKNAYREELIARATPAELAFKSILDTLHVQYEFQKTLNQGKSFKIVDFWLPLVNIVVEIDGGYHRNPIQIFKDGLREEQILKRNKNVVYKIVRFTNSQVISSPEWVIAFMKKELTFYAE